MTRPLLPSVDVLAPGQRIGPFVLLAPLGSGGSGRIWAAARLGQLGFNKRLVLKVMRQDRLSSASARRRFDREACLGGRLRHPNLRAVHDLRSCEGRPYMALSWVDTSLAELLQHAPGERLAPAVVCWIGMQCCSALTAAHNWAEQDGRARPIVHRDVSPGNILLSVEGHALLADLAAPDDEESSGESGPPRFYGSLAYAAPEALRQQALDARADLYSLGCVLYEALAGAPAFEGDDERTVMFKILERGAPALSTRAVDIPADVAGVVQRCLERRREDRFESARELHAALSACCAQRAAFSLERETAALIREVLGARIREREEMMHGAFERFAPSALARTDTLPIVGAETPPPLPRPSAAAVLQPVADGAGLAASDRRRWPLLVALLVLIAGVALLARERSRPTESVETRANRAAPPEGTAEAPGSGAAGGPATNGEATNAPAATEGAPSGAVQPPGDGGARAATPAIEPREPPSRANGVTRPAASATGPSASAPPGTRAAPVPTRRPREPAHAAARETRAPSDPFDSIRLEGNPYEKRVREGQPAPQPSAPPPRQPAPPEPVPTDPRMNPTRALPVQEHPAPPLPSPGQN